ncbi:MAG: competence protein CoiA family protein [Pseudomonadota bacterium]
MNTHTVPLVFALSGKGDIVHINDVERGLRCNAACPQCSSPLQARKGEKNAWHFAHHNSDEECPGSGESGLHLAAKEIILKKSEVRTPSSFRLAAFRQTQMLHLSGIELEPKIQSHYGYRPDLSAFAFDGTQPIHIEIHVTNKVSASKAQRAENSGVPMLEVHINAGDHEEWDWEKIEESVIHEVNNKSWISDFTQEPLIPVADSSGPVVVCEKEWAEPLEDSLEVLPLLTAKIWVRKYDGFVTMWPCHSPWAGKFLDLISRGQLEGAYSKKYRNWSTSRYNFRQVVKVLSLAHNALEKHGHAIMYGLSTDQFHELWPKIQKSINDQLSGGHP